MNQTTNNVEPESYSDKILKKLFTTLKENGVKDESIEEMANKLSAVVVEHTIAAILKEMDEQDEKNWNTFIATKPNDAQVINVLDLFYQKKTGRSIEEMSDEIIVNTVNSFTSQLTNREDLAKKISKLSDEQADKATQLLQSGNFEEAEAIINSAE